MASYDLIGSRETGAVAIVELAEGEDPEEVAREIMRRHKHVKSVLLKAGPRYGVERLRPLILVAGSSNTEVIHREYGMRLKLDPRLVYFSPREAEDRQEVASMVRPGERVLVMFAGVGPYAIAIARKREDVRVVGVEINPAAVRYFRENVRLNKVEDRVKVIQGDVRDVCPRLGPSFDRVLMPLPLGAYQYLRLGLSCIRPEGGFLHFYYFGGEGAVEEGVSLAKREAYALGLSTRLVGWRRVGSFAPRAWKFRIDLEISQLISP